MILRMLKRYGDQGFIEESMRVRTSNIVCIFDLLNFRLPTIH